MDGTACGQEKVGPPCYWLPVLRCSGAWTGGARAPAGGPRGRTTCATTRRRAAGAAGPGTAESRRTRPTLLSQVGRLLPVVWRRRGPPDQALQQPPPELRRPRLPRPGRAVQTLQHLPLRQAGGLPGRAVQSGVLHSRSRRKVSLQSYIHFTTGGPSVTGGAGRPGCRTSTPTPPTSASWPASTGRRGSCSAPARVWWTARPAPTTPPAMFVSR